MPKMDSLDIFGAIITVAAIAFMCWGEYQFLTESWKFQQNCQKTVELIQKENK